MATTSRFYRSLALASVLALTTWGCSLETLNQRSIWEDEHSEEDGHDHANENNNGSGDSLPTNTGGTTTGGTTTGGTTTGGTTTGGTTGGTTGDTTGGTTSITYTKDVAPIMSASCAGCHGSSGGVSLKTKDEVQKNFDASLSTIESGKMPKGGSKLSEDKITILKNWKAAGFPN